MAVTLAIAFAFLEQATATTTITTTNTDSNKVSQKRNSAEHISSQFLTEDVSSTVPSKPESKLSNLNPITNTQNKEIDCSVSPDSSRNASGNEDKMNTCQNVSKENFLASHMHSEESTNVVGNFQSNTQ